MKTFPMFLQMAGRHVVIVGGGEQAAQKARLMLKTEAEIVIAAPVLDAELAALVASGRARHAVALGMAELQGAALVFVATGCIGADVAAHALAKAAGTVVNVVDRPDLCDAVTPSLVDRDPVVVAIGTEGNAPVLARQLKTRIETMLEPNLGALAALAGRLRGQVNATFEQRHRRPLWEWVFSGAVRQAHARGAEHEAARMLKEAVAAGHAPGSGQGMLSLVAGGPGARDLLTLRAVQRLQEADIIFFDAAIDPATLDLARRDAERVPVPAGSGAWPQARLDALVLRHAVEGQRVVRLLAGALDPEARLRDWVDEAQAVGVAVEIVPGVAALPDALLPVMRAAG